jgi:predicted AlkP superfamily phosphohydrolase/phosphomutase
MTAPQRGTHRSPVPTAFCIILLVAGLAFLCLQTGCRESTEEATTGSPTPPDASTAPLHHPVLLIGVDGLEWDLVLRLLRDGKLPNLAQIMRKGIFGELESSQPTSSPIIWTSIATGVNPEKHGIKGFVDTRGTADKGLRLYNNHDRKTKAIWNILSDRNRSVSVIGWWMTYPVEPITGVMVAQTNTTPRSELEQRSQSWKGTLYAGVEGQVHPPHLKSEILAHVPAVNASLPYVLESIFGSHPKPSSDVPGELWRESLWSIRADEIYRRIALDLISRHDDFDLFTVYFGGTDVLGHRYWRYLEPDVYQTRPDGNEVVAHGELILHYYEHIDRVIGELVAAAPDEVNVIVVSDHGMHAVNTHGAFTHDLPVRSLRSGGHRDAPAGFFAAAGPDILAATHLPAPAMVERSSLPRVGSVLDVTPTLLALFGIPIGRDMDGAVMESVLQEHVLAGQPITWIDSHTPLGWRGAPEEVQEVDGDERVRQLRALGYLDDTDRD